ncbi:MAG TPA: hypothetical protein VJR46_11485 [Candidatus Dormibacteraeota bacterium]|nr:hypothetical protein [Candidatus Dormibacteraeota bacterium]
MQAAELESDFDAAIPRARAGRAIALGAASVVAIAVVGAAYVHPDLGPAQRPAAAVAGLSTDYKVNAINFVNPEDGWLLVEFPSGDYAVVHTADGGRSWTRQLVAPSDGHAKFMKFFDASVGVVALIGTQPVLLRTGDGGQTWVSRPALKLRATVLSWTFVDSDHGWMLAVPQVSTELPPARLYRTDDGGFTWLDLGPPVPAADQAFQVEFSYLTTGWLTTTSAGPYAYRTSDFGATWSKVPLPAPGGGWPRGGEFFVAVRPTIGQGVVASVVHFPGLVGRSGVGGRVRAYPPLTVRSFDGGRLRTFLYTTVLDQVVSGPFATESPPNQTELGTIDNGASWSGINLPSAGGAVGYFDAAHWWWIGEGMWSRSADGGATWSDPLDIGVINPVPGSLRMLDPRHAWFAGAAGQRAMLESTDDAGLHWTLRTLPPLEDRQPL